MRSPLVTGTSTGNDFPAGRTEQFVYSSGFAQEELNHNLIAVVRPEEVATGGPPFLPVDLRRRPERSGQL